MLWHSPKTSLCYSPIFKTTPRQWMHWESWLLSLFSISINTNLFFTRLSCDFLTGESRLRGIFGTSKCFCKPILVVLAGVFITAVSTPSDEYAGEWEHIGKSWLPSCEFTRESITTTNNSTNTGQNSNPFIGMSDRTRRSCLMKKKADVKYRHTVPLRSVRICCRA
jgi:hypothetical protein